MQAPVNKKKRKKKKERKKKTVIEDVQEQLQSYIAAY